MRCSAACSTASASRSTASARSRRETSTPPSGSGAGPLRRARPAGAAGARRGVGLWGGAPPPARGSPPWVFALLPRLLERGGRGPDGSITGLYTVLVEGDDMNEPIADTARSLLDGHVVLSRRLAAEGHYPAIDVLGSISRVMTEVVPQAHQERAARVRAWLAAHPDAEDLIQ